MPVTDIEDIRTLVSIVIMFGFINLVMTIIIFVKTISHNDNRVREDINLCEQVDIIKTRVEMERKARVEADNGFRDKLIKIGRIYTGED